MRGIHAKVRPTRSSRRGERCSADATRVVLHPVSLVLSSDANAATFFRGCHTASPSRRTELETVHNREVFSWCERAAYGQAANFNEPTISRSIHNEKNDQFSSICQDMD
jgi:hypothetical protein